MGVAVLFNYQTWIARYPEFSSVNPELAAQYWVEAGVFHRNDGGGPVEDAGTQTVLMNSMTAHIAQLNRVKDGHAVSDLVGRIDSASEGSVNVSATLDVPPGVPQYYAQTKYGIAYWTMTAPYRTF